MKNEKTQTSRVLVSNPFGIFAGILFAFLYSGRIASAEEHFVKLVMDYSKMQARFEPPNLKIKSGDRVTWINQQNESHNMATYPDGYPNGAKGFSSPYLEKKGERWSFDFVVSGTYEYHCIPHLMMGMRGKIIVDHSTPDDGQHKPTTQEIITYRDELLEYFDIIDVQKYLPKMPRGN